MRPRQADLPLPPGNVRIHLQDDEGEDFLFLVRERRHPSQVELGICSALEINADRKVVMGLQLQPKRDKMVRTGTVIKGGTHVSTPSTTSGQAQEFPIRGIHNLPVGTRVQFTPAHNNTGVDGHRTAARIQRVIG